MDPRSYEEIKAHLAVKQKHLEDLERIFEDKEMQKSYVQDIYHGLIERLKMRIIE